MSNQVQTQASKLWQTVAAPETAETYQKAATLTWSILKETGYLLWLVVCLVLVFGEWIWKVGYQTGYRFRGWINDFEKPTTDRLLSETGNKLLEAGKSSVAIALATAKDQLGIEQQPEPASPVPAASASTTPASAPAASTSPPAPVTPPAAAPTPAVKPSAPPSADEVG